MLDEVAALEHRDVGVAAFQDVDAHEVATRGAALAGAAAAPLERRRRRGRWRAARPRRGRHGRRRRPGRPVGGSARRLRCRRRCRPVPARRRLVPGRGRPGDADASAGLTGGAVRLGAPPPRSPRSAAWRARDGCHRSRGRASPVGGVTAGGRRSPSRGVDDAGASPASSRATSATSSVVRPRSAAASV